MKDEYYEIYGDLYDMYRRNWFDGRRFEYRALRWTTEAVEYSISELGLTKRVRPDAKHFLLVNLHQLVVLPLMHPESKAVTILELRDMLSNDVRKILEHSSEAVKADNIIESEISSHIILKTISKIWDQLSLNKIDVWG